MERLILLRHGKAEAGSLSGRDFDRRLTERGRGDAARVAEALAAAGWRPDAVLVSTAARARETWDAAAPVLPDAAALFVPALYNAAPEELLTVAAGQAPQGAATVMVVAHNPGLHQLALHLARDAKGAAADRAALDTGFPTGAAFAIDLEGRRFAVFAPTGSGGEG